MQRIIGYTSKCMPHTKASASKSSARKVVFGMVEILRPFGRLEFTRVGAYQGWSLKVGAPWSSRVCPGRPPSRHRT